ncbi:tetratricopeptide repeat protein [Lignipirellula cremea]|uniref:Uncharacterized protein n=1 Tax=Lignipirellula cremea TaxID=2528010 RepID=A0A518E264_9BACT|nr:hypothetical protein [Lignipirellula cremea]QDU98187.1 hypothetical protein Pla8534_60480 [Lignipirellula cremea]
MPFSPRIAFCCAALAVVFALGASPALAQVDQDRIFLREGAPKAGVLLKATPTVVTMNAGTVQTDIPVNDIRTITFGADTTDTKKLRTTATEGRYEEVVSMFEKNEVDLSAIKSPQLIEDMTFYIAYSMGQLALRGEYDKAKAGGALGIFIKKYPASWHYFAAVSLMADLAVSAGSYDGAAAYYKTIIDTAPWDDIKMQAHVGAAKAALAKADYPTAQSHYNEVMKKSPETDEEMAQQMYAKVGLAVCQAHANNGAQADAGIAAINDIIAKNDPKDMELFGRAYNALGDCHLAKGETEDALLAYLHTHILFYANPDVHAESLYNIINLWDKLQKPDRAQEARTLLRARYKGTRWATKS